MHQQEEQSLCQRLRGLPARRHRLGMWNDTGSGAWRQAPRCPGSDANALATCQHVGTFWLLRVTPRSMGFGELAGKYPCVHRPYLILDTKEPVTYLLSKHTT